MNGVHIQEAMGPTVAEGEIGCQHIPSRSPSS